MDNDRVTDSNNLASLLLWWAGRLVAMCLAGLFVILAIGEGVPNLFHESTRVVAESILLLAMLVGCIVGSVRRLAGGIIILVALAGFDAIEYWLHGRSPGLWLHAFAAPALLFIISWALEITSSRHALPASPA
jgi:hypothetical protein